MNTTLSVASGLVFAFASIVYACTIFWGDTRPTRGSWIMWAVLDVGVLWDLYAQGTVNGQIVAGAISSFCIMCIACSGWGKSGWTLLEKVCVAIFIAGFALWIIIDPIWKLALDLVLVGIACIPTYQTMWSNPELENRYAWAIAFVSTLLMLAALPTMHEWTFSFDTFALVAQPIVWLLTLLPVMHLLWWRPYMK